MLKLPRFLHSSNCILCHADMSGSPFCLCPDCINDLPYRNECCYRCGQLLKGELSSLCGACQQNAPIVDSTFSLFNYGTPIDHLIVQLKFSSNLLPADTLGKLMAEAISTKEIPLPDAIIPIPLHPKRLRKRGYNQALELAKPLSKHFGLPILDNTLIRKKHTRPQTECDGKERRRNMHGSFACVDALAIERIALVDDVITTGTTVNEAAKVLKQAGVKEVHVWACAQA